MKSVGQRNTNLQQKNLRHLRNLRVFYPKTEQVQNLCKSVKSVGQRNTNLQQKNLRHLRNLRAFYPKTEQVFNLPNPA